MSSYENSTSHIFLCLLPVIKVEDQTTRTALSWTKALAACLHSPFLRNSSVNSKALVFILGTEWGHLWS